MLRRAMACAVVSAAILWSTTIRVHNLERPVIEERLRLAHKGKGARHDTVVELFSKAGCADHLSEQPVKHAKTPNVICTSAGMKDSRIIVGAHYDCVDEGVGAIDNWSGAALLSSLYEGVKTVVRNHTFVFVAFTDEESGLVGSKYYVKQMDKDDLKKISAMVNLDSLGTSTTKFEMDRGDKRLALALVNVAKTFNRPLDAVNVHLVGRSDSDSFQDVQVPTILLHSLTPETFPLLHTKKDQLAGIHPDEYYDSYRLIQAYLAYLDEVLDAPTQ